jgi:galactose oxidase
VQASHGLWFRRVFHTSIVLPDGSTFITGGQEISEPFSDTTAQLTPEMYSPDDDHFIKLAPNSIVRVYHSMSLLLPDATVLNGGGGLCAACSTNHFDAQIYTPPYLFTDSGHRATRPVINGVSATSVTVGSTLTINTNCAVTSASMIRYGSSTHTVNTDQRRIPLTLKRQEANTYSVTVPPNPGIAIPGYWMLFVMNSDGVPSVATTIQVTTT